MRAHADSSLPTLPSLPPYPACLATNNCCRSRSTPSRVRQLARARARSTRTSTADVRKRPITHVGARAHACERAWRREACVCVRAVLFALVAEPLYRAPRARHRARGCRALPVRAVGQRRLQIGGNRVHPGRRPAPRVAGTRARVGGYEGESRGQSPTTAGLPEAPPALRSDHVPSVQRPTPAFPSRQPHTAATARYPPPPPPPGRPLETSCPGRKPQARSSAEHHLQGRSRQAARPRLPVRPAVAGCRHGSCRGRSLGPGESCLGRDVVLARRGVKEAYFQV